MSLKPGIGAAWLRKFQADVYPHDYVVVNAKETKPPRYYDLLYARDHPLEFEEIQFRRERDGRARYEDNTEARLLVKEEVTRARVRSLQRGSV